MFRKLFRESVAAKAYWWKAKDGIPVPNFGDALAPLVLARFADMDNIEWNPIATADIISVGSVLEHIPRDWKGYVIGSGILRETSKLKFDPNSPDIKVLAVRGPLSARLFPGREIAMGDPGVLAIDLIGERPDKEWDLGIVPHWQDKFLAERFKTMIKPPFETKVIDPGGDPVEVMRDIAKCKRIVTSSLHGMIVADSIGGIPRRVEPCDAMVADGGLYKFKDYSESVRCPFEPGKMLAPASYDVDEVKFQIYDAYRELSSLYGKS